MNGFDLPVDGAGHATVIGAGIVGVTAALELAKAGLKVRVVDKLPPGEGCSFGNAGVFAAASAQPLADAKTMMKAPGWVVDPMGPLHIRMAYLPRLAPWLVRFGWHGLFGDKQAATQAMHQILASSVDDYERLAREAGAADLVKRNGWVYAYNTESERRDNAARIAADRERGFAFDTLDARALQDRVPGISSHYIGGHHIRDIGHTPNPGRLVKALADYARSLGADFVEASVEAIERSERRAEALLTDRGRMPLDRLVVAAGAFSAKFTAVLGDRVPLDTERGYHVVIENSGVESDVPVMDAGLKAVVTPMEMGLRAAGTVELASADAPENPARAENVRRMAMRMYPAINANSYTTWMGCRPTLPDSLPVIGRASGVANAVYAFGHQHVGLTGAPATARIVRQLVEGRAPNLDIAPFRAARFR